MMTHVTPFLAVVGRDLPTVGDLGKLGASDTGQLAPILAAILGVVFLVILWAVFIRKPQRVQVRGRILDPDEVAKRSKQQSEGARRSSGGSSENRRRRRRAGRARNPTLAETGGLPPIRPSDAPPPGL